MVGVPALASSGPGYRLRWLAVGVAATILAVLIPRASPSPGRVTLESWTARSGWVALAPPLSRMPHREWSREVDARPGRIVVRGGGIYAVSVNRGAATVTAFDVNIGRIRWTARLPAAVATGGALRLGTSDRLLTVTDDLTGHAVALLDRVNGRALWERGARPVRVPHDFVAGKTTGGVAGGVALLTTPAGMVGLDPHTGTIRWRLAGARDPLVAEGGLFVRLDRGGHTMLSRLDLDTGRPVWTVPTGGTTPQIADGVLVLSGPYGLAAFDTRDGAPLWSEPDRSDTRRSATARTASTVTVTPVSRSALAVSDGGSVRVIDARTGAPRYARPGSRWVSAPTPLRTGQRNLVFGRHGQQLRLLDGVDGTPVASTDRITEVLAICSEAILVRRDAQLSALNPGNLATLWSIPDLPDDARLVTVDGALVVLTASRLSVYR